MTRHPALRRDRARRGSASAGQASLFIKIAAKGWLISMGNGRDQFTHRRQPPNAGEFGLGPLAFDHVVLKISAAAAIAPISSLRLTPGTATVVSPLASVVMVLVNA